MKRGAWRIDSAKRPLIMRLEGLLALERTNVLSRLV